MLTPIQLPKANAIVERLVGTFRRECVNHITAPSERHVRAVLSEHREYCNATRPHRTLELETPDGISRDGRVVAKPVFGGIHPRYDRKAA